ncbi:flavin reductase family protein [Catenulispora sp. NF23]|uniref:flavin reductase family protein n=1 Tax=Catenulispora pinistramenti TaxID=2705254 RepID=UPI001BA84101|nr:flavin reductase family protein [Catenulispora pinistramenti]MBS2537738.1 flavin reductase family protein [Catenulispora pinistramenti]
MHTVPGIKVLYFGTPVVLITTRNEDGTPNIAPMSSAWWLNGNAMLGLGNASQTSANIAREGECVLNLPSSDMAAYVDRIALTTGRLEVAPYRAEQGYRTERDKFGLAGLTEQESELVSPPRILECPIQMEGRLVKAHSFGDERMTAFEVEVLRTHVEEKLVIPGTHYIDPEEWDPLIMKFCEFFGGGQPVHTSRLAGGWQMPHTLRKLPVAESAAA